MSRFLQTVAGACLLLVLVPGTRFIGGGASPVSGDRGPQSWIAGSTLLTVYGRAFGTAPVLGRLGMDRSLDDVARQVAPMRAAIAANTGSRPVRVAIHLIYGLATPCTERDTCLLYLDEAGVDILRDYIEPAARRGWLVILDDQLGLSNPEAEIQRMIAKGYLAYDNVEVAFDPEFRTVPGQTTPGIPVGSVTSEELNVSERELNTYARQQGLQHQKLMLVHEFQATMVQRPRLLLDRLRYVRPVLIMDGIGPPAEKTHVYETLRAGRHDHAIPGIKLFPYNRYDLAGHLDTPMLTWPQVLGRRPATDENGRRYWMTPAPRVIVMT